MRYYYEIEGNIYLSMKQILEANLAKDRFQINRRIKSSNYLTWKKKEVEQMPNDYPERE